MKNAKHFPAILLALLLAACLLPATAFAADNPFEDVPDDAWYAEAVQYVYENGLMNGSGSTTTFLPDGTFSRGQLVTILHRMEGTPSAKGMEFADVKADWWYTDAIAWASANNIVNGDGVNFNPDNTITHEQMAAILYRYAKYKDYSLSAMGDTGTFPDGDKISAYAIENMNWAVGSGLFEGVGGTLAPTGGVNRAQAAMILMHFCKEAAVSYPVSVVSTVDPSCQPGGILLLKDGACLVTDMSSKSVWRVTDKASETFATGFERPWAIAPYGDGYAVSDPDGGVVRLVGTDGKVTGLTAELQHPTGLASDGEGNLYVADTLEEGVVYKITPDGTVSTFASGLSDPMGLCWKDGTLYIAETGANRIVSTTGGQVTAVAGGEDGFADGSAATAAFSAPQGVAVGDDGTVYVTDTANGAVRQIRDGKVSTLARRSVSDLESLIPVTPVGLAVDGGQLYVCESFGRAVFVITLAQ